MHKFNREKTAFITHMGHFQYKKLPFGLMNAFVNYQAAISEVLHNLNGKNVHFYVYEVCVLVALSIIFIFVLIHLITEKKWPFGKRQKKAQDEAA